MLVGFTVLMYGMVVMSDAVSPLAEMPEFSAILAGLRNPLLGLVVATLFTARDPKLGGLGGYSGRRWR